MKKLAILAVLLVMCFSSKSQDSFEGKITYSVEITGEGSELVAAYMFSSYEYYFSGNNTRLHLSGGMSFMIGDFIVNDQSEKSYMLMKEEKVAYEMTESEEEKNAEDVDISSIVKHKGTEKILKYKCTKYTVTVAEDSSTTVINYWVSTDLNPGSRKNVGLNNSLYVDGIDGFPLKIVTNVDGIEMTQIVTEISKKKLDASLFEVPSDYEIKDFSESAIGQFSE